MGEGRLLRERENPPWYKRKRGGGETMGGMEGAGESMGYPISLGVQTM